MSRGSWENHDNRARIAYWYYKMNMTQGDIAKRLKISRQKVNQIVGKLVEEGVVEIRIKGPEERSIELELELERNYALQKAFVMDVEHEENKLAAFGNRAAEALDSIIDDDRIIGVSWGVTLGAAIAGMTYSRRKNCKVVQLVGGLNLDKKLTQPDDITRLLAEKLSCDFNLLYAPAMIDSPDAREIILQDQAIKKTFDLINKCDLALLGVGELKLTSTVSVEGYMPRERLEQLIAEGYVGDLAMRPFTLDGRWAPDTNVIGVDAETLARIPGTAILAYGGKKAEAVMGALNTGCVDILIIDTEIAAKITKS